MSDNFSERLLLEKLAALVESMSKKQEEINDSVDYVKEIIYIGNNQRESVLTKLTKLEEARTQHDKDIEELKSYYNSCLAEEKKGRWHLITIMAISILGWVAVALGNLSHSKVLDWLMQVF